MRQPHYYLKLFLEAVIPDLLKAITISLSYPVKECYNLTACAILIDAECAVAESICDLILCSPQNCLVKDMVLRHIAERRFRCRIRRRLSLEPPYEGHDLTARASPVNTKGPITESLCDSSLGSPENCPVMRVRLRHITERTSESIYRCRAACHFPQEHNCFTAGTFSVYAERAVTVAFGDTCFGGPVNCFIKRMI